MIVRAHERGTAPTWRDAGVKPRLLDTRPVAARPRGARRIDRRENGRSDRRAAGLTGGAICVQRLDDSLNSAIHTRYRSSRRSSSMHEPRGPPLKVVGDNFRAARRRPQTARRTHSVCRIHTRSRGRRARGAPRDAGGTWRAARRPKGRGAGRTHPAPRGEGGRTPSLMDSSRPRRAQSNPFPPPALRGPSEWRAAGGNDARTALPLAERATSVMILPQVHLRKPCYDFYFL